MPSAGAVYDERLVLAASAPTKGQLQEGYNTDILQTPIKTKEQPSFSPLALEESPAVVKRIPWWRTRRGIAAITIFVVVALGAIIGGAVGGTVGKKPINSIGNEVGGGSVIDPSSSSSQPTSTSPTQHVGGSGPTTSANESSVETSRLTVPPAGTVPTTGFGGGPPPSPTPT